MPCLLAFFLRFSANCGPIALVRDGDIVTVDATNKSLSVAVSDEEMAARKALWKPINKAGNPRGVLAKYAKYSRLLHWGCHGHALRSF